MQPRLVDELSTQRIIDVVCGDGHCVALTSGYNFSTLPFYRDTVIFIISSFVLFLENVLYAWGNNSMGQCGLGHCQSPVTQPRRISAAQLENVVIHQISAGDYLAALNFSVSRGGVDLRSSCFVTGTSHTLAWTSLPVDRQIVAWHRPFCIDLQENTFALLRRFLEV